MESWMELWQLVKLVSDRYGARLQQHKSKSPKAARLEGMTVQQFQYLQVIGNHQEITVGEMAKRFQVRSPTATSILNRLVELGLIQKTPSHSDRRVLHLRVTGQGKTILKIQEDAFRALAGDIEGCLSPEELLQYRDLTLKVCENLSRLE